jgi:hypothetical protein
MYFEQLRILLLSLIMTDLNNSGLFVCKKCNFKCSKNSNFLKHLSTRKHEMLTSNLQKIPKLSSAAYVVLIINIDRVFTSIKKIATV